ncbi:3-hydroxyacyl-CoA dehydrogenase NAD-binding domain-containing protein [Zavarzinia compransoris]|uniref:3-hydroxyacyl-CoA dehydrogenase n=1 Tax=Zavarzinia compransoris TaxID=1264899 RepID=A0A317DUE8_9PROT|nr:3-hydroxyacyl-CoA dehydrogenase NAD-binding domain-containing protein [Zavarzinia compransoris]PWR18022.1 3-hydroxyacyl-CoA dehydrogenase [Zavarzinia compransoris]TDP43513.1 3-hydroxyacyl-CoA dehydrogenase [Zavarzinia compransoris]
MSELVHYARQGDVGVITIDSPPVNALGQAVRAGLAARLAEALADEGAKTIVLTGAGKAFSAGADIREFGKPPAGPSLPEVIDAFELSPKPVIAAIGGVALGGGLELALGCHYRVASPFASLGLPEVKLGLIPGAGGCIRLPRLTGIRAAADIMIAGEPLDAARAEAAGIVDRVAEGDVVAAAVRLAGEGVGHRRTRDLPLAGDAELLAAVTRDVAKRTRGLFSPLRIVEAIEAATRLPFEEALRHERELFLSCLASPQRKGLIHAFFAPREAAKVPGIGPEVKPRRIETVGIIGAGTMGGGIAMSFANAGIPVTLLETRAEALEKGLATIRANYEATAAKGRITAAEVEARTGLIRGSLDYQDLAGADLVIEAVFESMAVKHEVFRTLDAVCKAGAVLATNTSTLDIDRIAEVTGRPQDVVGMHFFSPANVMKLLENVRTRRTAPDVQATVMEVARRIGKVGVMVGVCYGFVGNRILHARNREAVALVNEGATPQQVDKVLTDFGFAMGPFATSDLAGLDVGWRIREERRKAGDPEVDAPNWLDALAERGRFGQKTRAGIYRYEAGSRTPVPDPETEALIADYRAAAGIATRAVDDREILERCLFMMVNEGARILDEGIAARASDIDAIWLNGYGFPAYRGGPMFWAEQEGLDKVVAGIEAYHARLGTGPWAVAPLLRRVLAAGRGFAG